MPSPTMNSVYQDRVDERRPVVRDGHVLTKKDVVSATLLSLLVVVAAVSIVVKCGISYSTGIASALSMTGIVGMVVFNLGMIISPKLRQGNVVITMIMSVLQGFMLGGIVFYIGTYDVGDVHGWVLVLQALMGTIGLFFAAVLLYAGGIVKVNRTFTTFLVFAVSGMGLLYLGNLIITMITGDNLLFSSGPIPIIIGVVAIILATMTLIADLNSVDEMVELGSDRKVRWALAASLTAGLVWLYMELLRVLFLVVRD